MSTDTKSELLTVRMAEDKYVEFQAAAKVRGVSMSALVTAFAYQIIREIKKEHPDEFDQELAELVAKRQARQAPEDVAAGQETSPPTEPVPFLDMRKYSKLIGTDYIPSKKKGGLE